MELPLSLATGDGVLVPLFMSTHNSQYEKGVQKWGIISKKVFLPKTIRYTEDATKKEHELPIRKMKAPTRIQGGIEIRG